MSITLKFKQGENNFELSVDTSKTVQQLKEQIKDNKGLSDIAGIKIIFKGKILKDADVLNTIKGLEDQSVLHVVLPKANTEGTSEQPQQQQQQAQQNQQQNPMGGLGGLGGMGGMGGMGGLGGMPGLENMNLSELMNNPQFNQMYQSLMSNPQMLQSMINSNPQLQSMMQNNPMMQQMMNDPATLQMLSDPNALQNMMQGLGGGNQNVGDLLNQMQGGGDMSNLMSGLGQMGGMPQQNTQAQSNQDPKEQYKSQLEQLKNMGFTNEQVNIDVLKQTYGNVDAAVEKLLGMMGN